MGFFRRVRNIVSANCYELLERCENPLLLLDQAVRDMEQAVRTALAGAAKVVAHERILDRQRAAAEREARESRARAEAAVRGGDEAGARHALRRQYDCEQLAAELAEQCAQTAAASGKLRRQVENVRRRLQSARRQRDVLVARQRAAEARRQLLDVLGELPMELSGFQEFNRLSAKVERNEAEADALRELTGESPADDRGEQDRAAADWIEAELRVLKGN